MPRGGARPGTGGARPGAGRPRKQAGPPAEAAPVVKSGQMTPLEYMLGVINDPSADESRRDRMAQAAAPYVHPKAEATEGGKKEQARRAAETAHIGTAWERRLAGRVGSSDPVN